MISRRRSHFSNLIAIKVNLSVPQDEMLRAIATYLGTGRSEIIRRFILDGIHGWQERGLLPPLSMTDAPPVHEGRNGGPLGG